MDMYVRMVDELKRAPDDNPSVGITLCTHKDASVVRYSILHENEQLFASKYKLVLPSEGELRAELDANAPCLLITRDWLVVNPGDLCHTLFGVVHLSRCASEAWQGKETEDPCRAGI
jgi:YhcG PDDEXK nuclease domain